MLYREIMAVCSQIHTKHINTLCGQNVALLNVKLVVHIVMDCAVHKAYSNHWAVEGEWLLMIYDQYLVSSLIFQGYPGNRKLNYSGGVFRPLK